MKQIILLFVMCIIGLFIRITALDKPEGLWNDEYMGWLISTEELWAPFFKKMIGNCHMPLYYLYLKAWTTIFGNTDLALRLSSVFTGILCIISTYFLGKEFKDKKTGIICALFATFSGFLIYFSQEVRLYNLIFIIGAWGAIFFIKSIRNLNKFNFLFYIFFNFLLLITHTISFVYVFFNLLIFSILILKRHHHFKAKIFIAYTVLLTCFAPLIPFLINVLTRETLSQNWGIFNLSKIAFVFIDYFTPIQTNITNSAINLITYFRTSNLTESIIFILLPISIATYFIYKAIKNKDLTLNSMLICSLLYFISLIVAATLGKLVLSTKYTVEIYPILILVFATGITTNFNKLSKTLSVLYFAIVVTFILTNPNAPQQLTRPEGHKTPALLLKQAQITEDDYIISLYHQLYRFEKYLDFTPKNTIEIDKTNIAKYLMGKEYSPFDLKHKGKEKLRNSFMFKDEKEINQRFDEIFENIPKGTKIIILIPNQVAFFTSLHLPKIAENDVLYTKTEIMFMAFSYAKIKLLNSAAKYCSHLNTYNKGVWFVITFQKL